MSTPVAEALQEGESAPSFSNEIAARSPLQLFWSRLRTDKVALVALAVIVFIILLAILAPVIVKVSGAHPPNQQNPNALDEFGSAASPSFSSHYYMGTDDLGRDVFSRVLYGARVSMKVALLTTLIAMVVGVTLGMVAGYYRGWVDTALSRMFDILLAFPVLLLALGLGAACSFGDGCIPINWVRSGVVILIIGLSVSALLVGIFVRGRRVDPDKPTIYRNDVLLRAAPGLFIALIGAIFLITHTGKDHKGALIQPGLSVVISIIAIANIPYLARIIRGQVLSIREKEFVEAARALGASDSRILFRHILPNLVAPIIVYATLLVPQNILFEAALSFLGVGVTPPTASWGEMISDAVSIFNTAWWFMTFPGLALLATVLAFNLVGDGLQDALNPRSGR